MLDILFIAFLGEREPEELLPEDEAERERLLQDTNRITTLGVHIPTGGGPTSVLPGTTIYKLYGGQHNT